MVIKICQLIRHIQMCMRNPIQALPSHHPEIPTAPAVNGFHCCMDNTYAITHSLTHTCLQTHTFTSTLPHSPTIPHTQIQLHIFTTHTPTVTHSQSLAYPHEEPLTDVTQICHILPMSVSASPLPPALPWGSWKLSPVCCCWEQCQADLPWLPHRSACLVSV